jgi:FkbM family methyltransferase
VIEQFEKLRAFSSRFSGDSALSVLKPILHLPFRSAEVDRRWQLVQMAHGLQDAPLATPALEAGSDENLNAGFWTARAPETEPPSSRPDGAFSIATIIAGLTPIRIVDIGAMAIADPDAYAPLAASLGCEVVGFEPLEEECEKRNRHARPGCVYLPYVIGDGSVQTFYETNSGMTSSLFEPNAALLRMFDNLEEHVRVVATRQVQTRRLDDVEEARGADFLKADVQGAELMVFQGAEKILRDVLVIHAEAEFVPLYKNQPLFADVDAFLRAKGFVLHKMAHCAGRLFKPFSMARDGRREPSQWLWCDAVYVRDFLALDRLSEMQLLKLAAILHENYGSHDIAALALSAHDRRTGSNYQAQYLRRLENPASA